MTFSDRYRSAGFERNPFSIEALNDAPIFLDRGIAGPPPPWSSTLVQVIGDKGFGKSTHLAQWQQSQPGPYHYIPHIPYGDRWARPPAANRDLNVGTIYGDEIDRMPRPLRTRWFRTLARAGATLVIGTHEDLRSAGRSAGFTVRTHHLQPFTSAEFRLFIDAQLHAASLDTPQLDVLSQADRDEIFARSGGVPRDAQLIGHRIFAERIGNTVAS